MDYIKRARVLTINPDGKAMVDFANALKPEELATISKTWRLMGGITRAAAFDFLLPGQKQRVVIEKSLGEDVLSSSEAETLRSLTDVTIPWDEEFSQFLKDLQEYIEKAERDPTKSCRPTPELTRNVENIYLCGLRCSSLIHAEVLRMNLRGKMKDYIRSMQREKAITGGEKVTDSDPVLLPPGFPREMAMDRERLTNFSISMFDACAVWKIVFEKYPGLLESIEDIEKRVGSRLRCGEGVDRA